jgi:hypothetical protein
MVDSVSGPTAPASFDEDHMDEWSLWVLENGLPDLPVSVQKGESVPEARWAGGTVGAVLQVRWTVTFHTGEDLLVCAVKCCYRVDGAWQLGHTSGGSGWFSALLERRGFVGPGETLRFGEHGEGGCCLAPYGITGTAARFIEVETGGRVERAPLESPIGAWVAAWEPASTATVRILGEDDVLLYSKSYAPWPWYTTKTDGGDER